MKKSAIVVSILVVVLLLTGCPNVINYTPILEITDQSVCEGQTLTLDLRDFTFDKNMEKIADKFWDSNEKMTYSIVSGRGEISGYNYAYSPGYTEEGTYTVQIMVTDNWGSVANDSFSLNVIGANATPTLYIPDPAPAVEGEPYIIDLSLFATDLDLDELTFELLTEEGTITGSNFSFNPDFGSAGVHTVTIKVSDSAGASSTYTFEIFVNDVNRAPVIEAITGKTVNENEELSFSVSASDPDGDYLTYSLEGPGILIGNSYSWTPDYDASGTYDATVTVSDGEYSTATSFTITVNDVNRAPVIDLISDKTVAENSELSFTVLGNDPDGDSISYSLEGPGSLSGNSYSWTPGYDYSGTYPATVTVSDGEYSTATSFTITVSDVNRAPTIDPISDKTVVENSELSFTVSANDPDGDSLSYSLEGPGSLSGNSYSWTPDYDASGTYDATVTVTDGIYPVSISFTITVSNANRAPVIETITDKTVNENEELSFSVSASDPDGDSLSYSLEGPGSLIGNSYSWTPDYDASGTYDATITVEDYKDSVSTSFKIAVNDVNRAPVLTSIGNQTVNENETLTLTFTASDPDGDTTTISYDGSGTYDSQTNTLSWTTTHVDAGTYTATVAVSDGKGGTDSESFSIEVVDVLRIYNLTITTSPESGLKVKLNGTEYTSPKIIQASEGTNYTFSVPTPQYGDTGTNVDGNDTMYSFHMWMDGVTANERTYSANGAMADNDANFTAQMTVSYKVETETYPANLATVAGAGWHPSGESLQFTAQEVAGNVFGHWEINGVDSGSANPISVTADSPKSVVAVYHLLDQVQYSGFFGGSSYDYVAYMEQSSDGGYILCGTSKSSDGDLPENEGSDDYWAIKLNSSFEIEWSKTYGGSSSESAYCIRETSDGGYILCGSSLSTDGDVTDNIGGRDCWILKLDSIGNPEWKHSYGGLESDNSTYIRETETGYIVAGTSCSDELEGIHGTANDIYLINLDFNGNMQWQKCLGGTNADSLQSMRALSDGYILISMTQSGDGDLTSPNLGSFDCWIVRLDLEGNIIWSKTYGGSSADMPFGISSTSDGGFIVTGSTESNDYGISTSSGSLDLWLFKIDCDGNMEWQETFGGSSVDIGRTVMETDDGESFVVGGETQSSNGDVTDTRTSRDWWIIKVDSSSRALKWQKCVGGSDQEYLRAMCETTDNQYLFSGITSSVDGDATGNNKGTAAWIVKLVEPY